MRKLHRELLAVACFSWIASCSSGDSESLPVTNGFELSLIEGKFCADVTPFNDGVGAVIDREFPNVSGGACESSMVFNGPAELKLDASFGELAGCCGRVALEGDILVVGAGRVYYGGTGSELNSRLYIYTREDDGEWSLNATVHEERGGVNFNIDGGRIVATSGGNVFVYERGANKVWQSTELSIDNSVTEFPFGTSIAIHESTIVIGAVSSVTQPQAVDRAVYYVFEQAGFDWILTAKLQPEEPAAGAIFGLSLALHANRIVVGTPARSNNAAIATVFEKSADAEWRQTAELTPSDEQHRDAFFLPVALNDSVIAVGNSNAGNEFPGYAPGIVFLFHQNEAGDWVEEAVVASDILLAERSGDIAFGRNLDIVDNTLLVGSAGEPESGSTHNSLYVYDLDGPDITSETVIHYDNADYSFGDEFSYDNGLLAVPRFGRFFDEYDPAVFLYQLQR